MADGAERRKILRLGEADAAWKTLDRLAEKFPRSKTLAPSRVRLAEAALAAKQYDRAAEQFWEGLPFKYDHVEIVKDPQTLEAAPTKFDADRADEKFLFRLPGTLWAMFRASRLTKKARQSPTGPRELSHSPAATHP